MTLCCSSSKQTLQPCIQTHTMADCRHSAAQGRRASPPAQLDGADLHRCILPTSRLCLQVPSGPKQQGGQSLRRWSMMARLSLSNTSLSRPSSKQLPKQPDSASTGQAEASAATGSS